MTEINNLLKYSYTQTSLEEMSDVQLMNRTDTKFIFNICQLKSLLIKANEFYKVLAINNEPILDYRTQYFDTPNYDLYISHQNKKLNRYKIRQREYFISNIAFMEVKFKSNKSRTIKKRFKIDKLEDKLSLKSIRFINNNSTIDAMKLQKSILNGFSRVTLVHSKNKERVTIDFKLSFSNKHSEKKLPYLVIVEVKREGTAHSDFIDLF